MPDQKRQSLGQSVDVDHVEDNSSFPKGCGWQSSNALVWVSSLKNERGMNEMVCPLPFFCTYLFIVIYYDSSAETLLWDQIQGGDKGHSPLLI